MWIPSRVTRKINPNQQVGLSPKSRPKYLWFQWMLVGRKDHDLVVWIHGLRGHGGGPRFAGFGGTRRPSWRVNSRYIQNPKDSGISTYLSLGSTSWDKGKTWNDHKLFHSSDWWCLDEWVYFVCSKGVFECCSKVTQTTIHKTARFPKILLKRQNAKKQWQTCKNINRIISFYIQTDSQHNVNNTVSVIKYSMCTCFSQNGLPFLKKRVCCPTSVLNHQLI